MTMVSPMRSVYLISLLAMTVAGCKSSEFTGSSGRKPAVTKKVEEDPTDPKKTTKDDPKKTDDDTPIDIDDNPTTTNTNTGTDDDKTDTDVGDSGDNSTIDSILDIIGGLTKVIFPDDTINDENRIVFGNAKGFHIGDANFDASSNCALTLKAHDIKGTKYYFEFEVKKDSTKIDIKINEVCGVDYNTTNFASIEDAAGTQIQKKTIVDNSPIVYDSVTLNAGKYKMIVESTQNTQNNNDRDDFLVKKLEIKSDKPIIAGKVGAQ